MDKSKIKNRYEEALKLKNREQYAKALKDELSKQEWKDELDDLSTHMESIASEKEYEKFMNKLVNLFDRVYEKIAAPGLDKFIEWIKENSKNETNANKLRAFLIKDYEKYSSKIDDILAAIDSLPNDKEEKRIFNSLVVKFLSEQKSVVLSFLNKPDLFINNIDTFLDSLKTEFEGLSGLPELSYTSVEDLYNDDQKKDQTISFYITIINNALAEGQQIKAIDDDEKNKKLWIRAKSRITSIKKCISILENTGIAKSSDENLKYLFTRFDKEMLKTKGDVSRVLYEYIEKTWNPLQAKYDVIKSFYEDDDLEIYEDDWDDYEKKSDLDSLLLTYRNVRKGNILPTLKSLSIDKVTLAINKCYSSIGELQDKENNTRAIIKQQIEEFYKQYSAKHSMLEKLVAKQEVLKPLFDSIYAEDSVDKLLPNIKGGYEGLVTEGSLLLAMSKDNATIYETLRDMKEVKKKFMEIMKQSHMEKQIDWINSFGDVTTIDENTWNSQNILDLLKNGLITLSFDKTF